MRYSLIMVTHNRWDLTRKCLESLWLDLPKDCEVLVVDNASSDQTREELSNLADRIRYLPQEANLGFAAANNLAAAQASGDILFFVNNDLIFRKGWWEPMVKIVENNSKVGVVGNIQWNPKTKLFDHMGIIFKKAQPIHFGEQFWVRPFRGATEWGAVTGACWAIRREVFLEAGGFDIAFKNGYEDVDLCLKLGERGFRHFVANDSVVTHWVSSSPGRHEQTEQNTRIFLERWASRLATSWSLWDERIVGWNYLLQLAMHPLIFNFDNLKEALGRVFLCHPSSRSLPKGDVGILRDY